MKAHRKRSSARSSFCPSTESAYFAHRTRHNRHGAAVALIVFALSLSSLLLALYLGRSPSTVIQQRFDAPVNAPIINVVRIEQQAEVSAQVQP